MEPSALLVIALAAVSTYASRAVGAMVSGKINVDSPIIDWITCVTYALLAGLVVRLIWMPVGALAETPDWMRFGAAATGFAVFLLSKHNVGLGVLSGSLVLVGLTSFF